MAVQGMKLLAGSREANRLEGSRRAVERGEVVAVWLEMAGE